MSATLLNKWAAKQALHQMKQHTGQAPKDHLAKPEHGYQPAFKSYVPHPLAESVKLDKLVATPGGLAMFASLPKNLSGKPARQVQIATAYSPQAYYADVLPKTQKARGVLYGRLIGHHKWGVSSSFKHDGSVAIQVFPGKKFKAPHSWPQFARPCPVRPRHGFVESRKVNTMAEAMEVLNETLLVEREAEMILMPVLSGKYSAVATNAGVVWGFGNDGATSKPGGVLIPANSSGLAWSKTILEQAVTASEYDKAHELITGLLTDTAYLEIVEDSDHTYIVQVRDGPEQAAVTNWIPDKRVVDTIITPDGPDLLKWEKKVKEYAGPGAVVLLPAHTLSDHFAVHAIAAGLPVITDGRSITLGQMLEPETLIVKWYEADYHKLAKRVRFWLAENYFTDRYAATRNRLMTAVGTMHAMGTWAPQDHLINLMGNAMVSLVRASASATTGEMRHWFESGPGQEYDEEGDEPRRGDTPPPGPYPFGDDFWSLYGGRDQIYEEMLKPRTLSELNTLHESLARDFDAPGWDSSFGGKRWGDVARAGRGLGQALEVFLEHPDGDTWPMVAQWANTFVHTAHNNGVALNKWLLGLDDFVKHPQLAWLNPFAAEMALNAGKAIA